MPVCLWVGQLIDAGESEGLQLILSMLWWRWLRHWLKTGAQSSVTICMWVRTLDRSCNGSKTIKGSVSHLWGDANSSSHTTSWHTHTFSTQPSCTIFSSSPLPAVPLRNLWVIGTDGWQLLAVSLGSSTPPLCSTAPGLLQLMAWLQRLPQNSNAAPISFSASWGVMRREGRGGVRWWRRLEREDYCWQRRNAVGLQVRTTTQSLWCKVVCVWVCLLQVCIHACFPFLLYIFVCLWVCDHYSACPCLRYCTV